MTSVTLYIANCTRQNQIVCFRLDFDRDGNRDDADHFRMHRQQDIAPGRQSPIGGRALHQNQATSIVGQLRPYGLVGVEDVNRLPRRVVPYVFAYNTPVSAEVIRAIGNHNKGIMITGGQERRKRAAVAINDQLANTVMDADIPVQHNKLEVDFEQQEEGAEGEKRIEEGFRVTSDVPGGADPHPNAPAASMARQGRRKAA